DYDPEFSPFYSYAIYNKYELINNYNEYPFPTRLDKSRLPVEDIHIINKGNYDELWYKVASDKYVVIARKVNSVIEAITLFAYIFCAFLFLVSCFRLLSLILQSKFRLSGLRKLWQLNIRTQVHTTIIFISLFSFVVIGIATISFFINRYNNNNRDRLSRAMQIMVNDLKNKIDDQHLFVGLYEGEHFASDAQLQSLIDEISEIHNTEVNLYDLNGQLKVTSRQIVYEKGILSEKMNPVAYYKLNKLKQVQVVQREHIGKLEYLSIYAPVRDESGNAFAYLNIPYFASQKELNQEISNFLVTIINLNAFIFLIAGVIALFIANRITQSFSVIGDKMKEVNLGKLNEEIIWKRDDEIGELVNEYNKMVRKLGESAAALAKSEREGAWREMARQVAHEIKNPLTPMKLSIQYLQKAIDNNSPNVKEMTASVASTLIEQIEHLSKIASDFSQFANIGNTRHEVFDLNEIINSLVELYQTNENLIINWQPVDQPVIVDLDKTQMNRLFTNLIQNAWEAYESDSISQVSIIEELQGDDRVQIRISDKGTGIPKEMHSRIFTPNFTTKSSGTGLGLAMCKSIVEQAKGDIWFETSEEGTTFYVVLPIKKNKVSD
ncbi:MAG TPA: HAMP domain-containing sensor histidine kinase, partial [Parasegetibacter sp.]